MEKVDRLGWAAGISFICHGARIGIRVNDPGVLDHLPAYLPPSWKPSASPVVNDLYSLRVSNNSERPGIRHFHLLFAGASRAARTLDVEEVYRVLESYLDFNVAVAAQRRLFVRAGVVAWHGKAIVILGPHSSGKTTLVAALVRAGAKYYSDEYAVFDRQGRVHPYPKPLSFRPENGNPSKKILVEELGGCAGTRALPVGLIAVTEYDQRKRWRPRSLSPGQAMLELFRNALIARVQPNLSLPILRRVVLDALTLKGRRDEAEDVVLPLVNYLSNKHANGRR